MSNRNYVVRFYKMADPNKPKEKSEFLGSVEIDDTGVSNMMPLTRKAFLQAPPRCLYANKVKIERI
jgi:hypothetical protein